MTETHHDHTVLREVSANPARDPFLDFAKGVLILLVTWGHAIQYITYWNTDFWEDPVFKCLYMFHMPLFMGISGYLSYGGIQRKPFRLLIPEKFRAYMLPVLVWAVIGECLRCIIFKDSLFIELPLRVLRAAPNGLWFLWCLFACIVFIALVRCIRYRFGLITCITALLIILTPEKSSLYFLKFMLPYFLAGYWIADRRWLLLRKQTLVALFICSFLMSVTCFLYWHEDSYIYSTKMVLTRANLPNIGLRYLAGLCASIVTLIVLNVFYTKTPDFLRKAFARLGRDSLYIYILQIFAFTWILDASKVVSLPLHAQPAGAPLALVASVILVTLFLFVGGLIARQPLFGFLLFGKKLVVQSKS